MKLLKKKRKNLQKNPKKKKSNLNPNQNQNQKQVIQGSDTTDDGLVEYMRYRKADEDVNFSKDIYVNQDIKAYFHLKKTGKNSYIFNESTAGVNHFK